MILKHYLTVLLCGFTLLIAAQSANRRPGELLVQLTPGASIDAVLPQLSRTAGTPVSLLEVVVPEWRIYLLKFEETPLNAAPVLDAARRLPQLQFAQWNHIAEYRNTEPDDTHWSKQADMELIGMPKAWDISTGGLTVNGDTIVAAILEKGSYLDHPDLAPNVWYNWGEIPNNGKDDDGNGYTDDYRGWNPRTKNDDPGKVEFHGTAVNGIIGAKGDNNKGIAGLNWNVKLMNLGDVEIEKEIVAAYGYTAKMRRIYNESNGAKGAFVVATNASFGINNGRPEDFPLWCAVYDSLGAVGILSVGATANQNIDVDAEGDMPTTCPSDYLIAVTEVNQFDSRMNAGYGKVNIDLAAPGTGTFSTYYDSNTQSGTYNNFAGTSAATPHVSGAIAFLYSLNCKNLVADAFTQPDACARRIRDLIFDNVAPNPDLNGITVTEGRLSVENAVQAVEGLENCEISLTGPLAIEWLPNHGPVHTVLKASFQTPTYNTYQVRVFNMLGQLIHEEPYQPDPFSDNTWEYDFGYLPAGVYTLTIGRNSAVRSKLFLKI